MAVISGDIVGKTTEHRNHEAHTPRAETRMSEAKVPPGSESAANTALSVGGSPLLSWFECLETEDLELSGHHPSQGTDQIRFVEIIDDDYEGFGPGGLIEWVLCSLTTGRFARPTRIRDTIRAGGSRVHDWSPPLHLRLACLECDCDS